MEANVLELRGRLGSSHKPLVHALELFEFAAGAVRAVIDAEWNLNPDPESRVQILRPLLIHISFLSDFVDGWLSHGLRPAAPLSLLAGLERECEALGLPTMEPIVAVGEPNNFTTITVDIKEKILEPLGPSCPAVPAAIDQRKFAVLRVPRLEGADALWRPVTLGHELAHLVVKERGVGPFDLVSSFDFEAAQQLPDVPGSVAAGPRRALAMFGLAQKWLEELICDAYAVFRFGPAGVAGLAEFLEVVGATDRPGPSHPHARLRIQMMLNWLGAAPKTFDSVLDPWRELLGTQPPAQPAWVGFLETLFGASGTGIWTVVEGWGTDRYDPPLREAQAIAARSCLRIGRPPSEVVEIDGQLQQVDDADIVNAAWLSRSEDELLPFGRLADKALDSLEFLRVWSEAGGEQPDRSTDPTDEDGAVLTADALRCRVLRDDERQLFVSPLLPDFAAGAGLDVRLGNRFIVFARSRTPFFDPLSQQNDPRSMQHSVELGWGDRFVLHPNEVVLAATLEYLGIPGDLTAQVITRSSYGRLGLLSATAVQVHPYFHGCLTLELVNLGVVPIELTPGERIAQLVVMKSTELKLDDHRKYRCPTGPEFSRVRDDDESVVLRRLSRSDGPPVT